MKNYSFRADKELSEKIEKFVDSRKISKASLFSMSVNMYIEQQLALAQLPQRTKESVDMLLKIEKLLGQKSNKYGLDEIEKQK